jgi:hypothetical protein
MACQDERDARSTEGFDDIQVLLARDAEDVFDSLVLKRCDEQVRSLGHQQRLSSAGQRNV